MAKGKSKTKVKVKAKAKPKRTASNTVIEKGVTIKAEMKKK